LPISNPARPGPVAAFAAGAAIAEEPTGSAVATGDAWVGAVAAPAAVAEQDPAGLARLTHGATRAIAAVADQRAIQERQGGRVDEVQQGLLHVGGLGAGIGAAARDQALHELVVKRRRPGTEGLIASGVRAEQRRDLR
jgi:hypothetical protein